MNAVTAAGFLIAAALVALGVVIGLVPGYLAYRSIRRDYETTARRLRNERDYAEAVVAAAIDAGFIQDDAPKGRHERNA